MMARRGVLGLMVGAVSLLVGGCGRRNRSLRYRITVEVNTPSGVMSGSSVLENESVGHSPIAPSMDSGSANTYGQAPIVDLGNGRFVFALLNDPNYRRSMTSIVLDLLRSQDLQPPLADVNASAFDQANATKPFGVIRLENSPMLVTFGNVNDPQSVTEVDASNAAGALGSGYSIKQIVMQVMDEDTPLTEGIEEKFSAISQHELPFRKKAWGTLRSDDQAGDLSSGHFVWRKK